MEKKQNYTEQRENIINNIIDLLECNTNYENTFVQINAKFGCSKRTFCKFWKDGKEMYLKASEGIRKKVMKETTKKTKASIKTGLISKERVLKELLYIVEKGKQDRDKINALKLICDVNGYKAPVKTDLTLHPVTPIFSNNPLLGNITDAEFEVLE
jgi:hypothetical protein